jgi:hypothetical protein
MAGIPKAPQIMSATPRELRRQAGTRPALPTPQNINPTPQIRPNAPSMTAYGKTPPLANPANLGQQGFAMGGGVGGLSGAIPSIWSGKSSLGAKIKKGRR